MKVKKLAQVSKFIGLFFFLNTVLLTAGFAQNVGDYRSRNAVMNWNSASDWEIFNGTAWNVASQKPANINSVFIQNGHIVTLTANEACQNLHISTGLTTASDGIDAQVALTNYTLEIHGKLRSFAAPVGTIPGTSVLVNGEPITAALTNPGKISFVGDSRAITYANEWSANNLGNASTFAIEINLNPGAVATLGTVFKASGWNVVSGTLDAGVNRIAVDNGSVDAGDFIIATGATFISAKTGTGSNAVLSRGATTNGGNLVVNGTLILSGLSPAVGMKTIALNGTVEYARSGNQTFLNGLNSGAIPLAYQNIKLSGSGTKTTLAANITTIKENGILELTGSALFALGTTASLTVSPTNTQLFYKGTAAQTTGIEWITDFSEIIIDNPAGVTLNTARSVVNKLSLIRGSILTTATRTLTIGENGLISGGNGTSFINGPLTWVVNTMSQKEVTFPIGKGAVYKPVALKVTQSAALATNYTAEMFVTAPTVRSLPIDLDDVSSIRYYKLTKGSGGASISQASLKIFYGSDDVVTDPVNLRIAKSSGTNWINQGGTGEPMVDGAGNITSDVNFTTLGDFVLANAKGGSNPLPVTLVYFKVGQTDDKVTLQWQTSCEKLSDRFEIERSGSDMKFETIGSVKAAGTTTDLQNYSFKDYQAMNGIAYYRLKQIDLDGTFAYSKVIVVPSKVKNSSLSLFPNPAIDKVFVQIPGSEYLKVEIINGVGQVLISKPISVNQHNLQHELDIALLPAGIYKVVITGHSNTQSLKFVKK